MSEHEIKESVFLVGMMGAGKSTIGKILAESLGYGFVDLDKEMEKRCNATIPCIFALEGEAGFRKRETDLLDEFLRSERMVVATGGGAPVRVENRERMKKAGVLTVHLEVSPQACYERVKNTDRPLLQCADPRQKICALIKEREPFYKDVSRFSVNTDGKTSRAVAEELKERLSAMKNTGESE